MSQFEMSPNLGTASNEPEQLAQSAPAEKKSEESEAANVKNSPHTAENNYNLSQMTKQFAVNLNINATEAQ